VIDRDEIDAMSASLGVAAAHVQRDYVFGWLLAGLYGDSPFADRLILKGGNALPKVLCRAKTRSTGLELAFLYQRT
jgi:predicted nucleotidyltransferase component of viral defense system